MAAVRRLTACRLTLVVAALVAPHFAAEPLVAQEPVRPDSARADTTLQALPDSVREVFGQQAAAEGRIPAFPERLLGAGGPSVPLYDCDRACLNASTAFTLVELLVEKVPGITPLRAGFFGGPHHALDGPYGPGFVRLYLDGRELSSLESGQVDLLRLSLVYIDRIVVYRRADGFLVDVSSLRQADPRAYSRISGGTGNPGLQTLNLVFTNGLGSGFTLGGAFELLDTSIGGVENDRFDFWGRLSWMPGSNRLGFQLDYRNESVDRSAADTTDFSRREILLRARAELPLGIQGEAYGATARFRVDSVTLRSVDQVGVGLAASPGNAFVAIDARFASGSAYPSLTARLRGGYRIGQRLLLDAAARVSSWEDFGTNELRAGASFALRLGVPISLRADVATGRRGIPRPTMERADSVSFDAASASALVKLGPFALQGRYSIQKLERQIPFEAAFDSLLADGPAVDLAAWEVGVDGPVIPLGWLASGLSPIRLSATWRRHRIGGPAPRYVPQDLIQGELAFHDAFFDGKLEVWLVGRLSRRSNTISARSGETEPVLLPSYSWGGGHLMIRIADFRLFYRLTNPAGITATEIGGVQFPKLISVFGVRWEFFN